MEFQPVEFSDSEHDSSEMETEEDDKASVASDTATLSSAHPQPMRHRPPDRDLFLEAAELRVQRESAIPLEVPSHLGDADKVAWRIVMVLEDPALAPHTELRPLLAELLAEFGDVPNAEMLGWLRLGVEEQEGAVRRMEEEFRGEVLVRRASRSVEGMWALRNEIRREFVEFLASPFAALTSLGARMEEVVSRVEEMELRDVQRAG
ncbi:hypothetical protein HDU96_005816 [Phlyctochytrium bullatum]|nr:hypothetical protein HDU96_005816 [Phlyctochytrium bullatum]